MFLALKFKSFLSPIIITLFDPSGNVSAITETFSDSTGGFSTTDIGIPSDGALGKWKVTAHNRLDNNNVEINVSIPTGKNSAKAQVR